MPLKTKKKLKRLLKKIKSCKPKISYLNHPKYLLGTIIILLVAITAVSSVVFPRVGTKAVVTGEKLSITQNGWTGGPSGDLATAGSAWDKFGSDVGIDYTNLATGLKPIYGFNEWEYNGRAVSGKSFEGSGALSGQSVVDGSGNKIVALSRWEQNYTVCYSYVQKLDSIGTQIWEVPLDSGYCGSNFKVIPDGTGGAFVGWVSIGLPHNNIYVQKIGSDGSIIWDEAEAVQMFPYASGSFDIASDGLGGIFVIGRSSYSIYAGVYIQRINDWLPDYANNMQWRDKEAYGTLLTTAVTDNYKLISVGTEAVILWGDGDIYASKIDTDGDFQWGGGSITLCNATGSQQNLQAISDGAGGFILVWEDQRNGNNDIYAQKINSSGAPQWTSNGVAVIVASGEQKLPRIVTDGAGGAYIAWLDNRYSGNIYIFNAFVKRINSSNGSVYTGWDNGGMLVFNNFSETPYSSLSIVSDGSGGAYVVQESDNRQGGGAVGVSSQKIVSTKKYQSASVTSSIIKNDIGADWRGPKLTWSATVPSGSVTVQTRTGNPEPINLAGILGVQVSTSSYKSNQDDTFLNDGGYMDSEGNGNAGGYWTNDSSNRVGGASAVWASFEFQGDDNTNEISRIVMRGNKSGAMTQASGAPTAYDIYACSGVPCDPDSSMRWSLIKSGTFDYNYDTPDGPWVIDESFSPVHAKYIKIVFTDSYNPWMGDDGYIAIYEIEVYGLVMNDIASTIQWSDWSAPITSGSNITSPNGQYLQYKINLNVTDPNSAPSLLNTTNTISAQNYQEDFDISSSTPGTQVSTSNNKLKADLTQEAIDTGLLTLESPISPDRLATFSVSRTGAALGTYTVSLGNETGPVSLSNPLTLYFYYGSILPSQVSSVIVKQDVNHNGSWSLLEGDKCFKQTAGAGCLAATQVTQTYAKVSVNSLSDFFVFLETIPSYSPQPTKTISEPVTPETPATPATPITTTFNTLEEVLASILPSFSSIWGIDYSGGRLVWAQAHRRNIYQAYKDYLDRYPLSWEVNYQFEHEPNIDVIRFNILNSAEYKMKWGM